MPITPYYKDLEKSEVLAKNEVGFINYIIMPLWTKVNELLDNEISFILDNIKDNLGKWKEMLD